MIHLLQSPSSSVYINLSTSCSLFKRMFIECIWAYLQYAALWLADVISSFNSKEPNLLTGGFPDQMLRTTLVQSQRVLQRPIRSKSSWEVLSPGILKICSYSFKLQMQFKTRLQAKTRTRKHRLLSRPIQRYITGVIRHDEMNVYSHSWLSNSVFGIVHQFKTN